MNDNSSYSDLSKIDLVLSMFNQYLFQDCKSNIDDIIYSYRTDAGTSGNVLIEQMLTAIKDYTLDSIGLPLFQSILSRSGKNDMECREILNRIVEYKKYTKEQIEPARKLVRDIVAHSYIVRANSKFRDDPSGYLNYLKGVSFKSTTEDYLTSTSFDKLDINTIIAETAEGGVPSAFEWINDTFLPERCYPSHGLIGVVMPPGTGKSLFAQAEALHAALMGKRVHYLCMADMSTLDFCQRLISMYLGIPFHEAKKNLLAGYNELAKAIGDRLEITCIPAATITVDEYIDMVKDKPYDVCIVDYDSNFRSTVGQDSMYLVYGDIYEKLSKLTVQYNKLVFILAQPHKNAWGNSIIEMDMLGESARKAHSLDSLITRGREPGNLNGLGISKMVKNRRGEEQVVDYNIRLNTGRFKSLPKAVYDEIKGVNEKRAYTEAEIDQMIAGYNQARGSIHQQIAHRVSGQGYSSGPRPF